MEIIRRPLNLLIAHFPSLYYTVECSRRAASFVRHGDLRVADSAHEFMSSSFGQPSTLTHLPGWATTPAARDPPLPIRETFVIADLGKRSFFPDMIFSRLESGIEGLRFCLAFYSLLPGRHIARPSHAEHPRLPHEGAQQRHSRMDCGWSGTFYSALEARASSEWQRFCTGPRGHLGS